jgi:murein L,D-transpeptidase YafK
LFNVHADFLATLPLCSPVDSRGPFFWIVFLFGFDSYSQTSPLSTPDRILIIKSTRTLSLVKGSQTLKSYKVALGTDPVGAKERQGDHKTPEGQYVIDR